MSDANDAIPPRPTIPMPTKRGPDKCNRIPETYEEAIARLKRRPAKRRSMPKHRAGLRRLVRRWLLELFDPLIDTLADLAERVDRLERRQGEAGR